VSVRDRLQRRVIPRAIVATSTIRWPARTAAALRRARGGRGRVQLYLAFDDPYSALAVLALADRVEGRRADLRVDAVVARGIPDDPAVDDKRRYAITDARRLARRAGLELSRGEPLPAATTAFLAGWTAAIPEPRQRADFCVAAMRLLWFGSDGPVSEEPYAELWREHVGGEPPEATTVERAERRMRKRGLYDTPIAVVHRQWFFAHERLDQIEHSLDELGWAGAR
jgi:2-hydroxychromene-2-carboxylate isomerase